MQANQVTCILTSCGRFDLLRITLESFFKFNTYDITDFFIYEDSGEPVPAEIKEAYPFIKWVEPVGRTGQIVALDTLWQSVKTPYAFTIEDDWEFLRPGFIEKSMKILELDPAILMVWLNALEPHNVHPVNWSGAYGILSIAGGLWSGTRFNPALKRKADYDLIGSYGKHTQFNPERPWKAEADIAKVYYGLGFKGATLSIPYMRHIGENRHVKP